VLLVATLAVYIQVWTHDFVGLDDFNYVVKNPQVAGGLTARGVAWAFTTGHESNWHPLTWLSHMLDVQLWGLAPGPHHLTNLAFHLANTLLLLVLLHRMTADVWRSAVVAGLFALHPLHVESVAWVAERKDVLSTLFWLLTTWAYVSYVRRPGPGRYAAALAAFALGLMSKPMLVTLPFVLLLLDVWPLGRVRGALPELLKTSAGLITEKLPFFALTVASSVITFMVQQRGGAVAELDAFPLGPRLANVVTSYVAYLGKTFWPTGLAVIYPYPTSVSAWRVTACLVFLLAVTALVLRAARRAPYLPVGWLWYLGTLVPVIGVVQVGSQAMADRYTYVPSIGVFIMVVWGVPDLLARWPHRRVVLPAVATAVLAACAALTALQLPHWKNSTALWTWATRVTSGNFLAEFYLADHLAQNGRAGEAVPHYVESLRITPSFVTARNNLGFTLASLGRVDEAIGHYNEILRVLPHHVEARNNLALAYAAQGKLDDAIRELREAIRIVPGDAESHFNLAALLRRKGQLADAAHHYTEALRLKPGHAEAHYRLGVVLADQGNVGEAARHLRTALTLDPKLQRARRALDELASRRGDSGPATR
jgi:Flp pilus assembly protein TadD